PAVRGRLLPGGEEGSGTAGVTAAIRNESVRFRLLTWAQTLRMARAAPLTGHGLGRFQVVYPAWRLPEIIRMFKQHSYMTDHPENLTLELLAELGVPGLGLWLWLLAYAAHRLAARLRTGGTQERRLAAACAGGLAGLLATNSFGVDIHYGATAALAACLYGIATAAGAPFQGRPPRVLAEDRERSQRSAQRVGPSALLALALALLWVRAFAADAALARALAASTAGGWDQAVRWYGEARALNPAAVMARYFGAAALLDRGRPEDLPEAERLLDGVRREAPDYVLLNYKYWLLYNGLGRRPDARRALARQIELDPLAGVFYLERGRQAMDDARWEDARTDFETACRVEPDSPMGYQYLGNLLVTRGRSRDALAAYARGLARVPDSPDLHYNAAVAAYKLGDRALARAHAEAVLRLQPDHPQARLILARVDSRGSLVPSKP
ncbi:MAG: tetratricopeptide repeat protein, partial [bacterium]